MKRRNGNINAERGFTLIEVLIALLILGIVSGAILRQIDTAQQRARTEQAKLDNFAEARDFIDQFFRDINQIGYPNDRMFDTTSPNWSPALYPSGGQTTYTYANKWIFDHRLAMGLVKIADTEIRFEADSNGDGNVETLVYMINGSGTCGLCLQRSQANKVDGDPLTGQTLNWGTEVNDVQNSVIFKYFDSSGAQITTPQDITTQTGGQALASVKTIQISLTIRNNAVIDPKTKQPIETNFEGEVSLNNCSMAAEGAFAPLNGLSCQ